MELPKGLTVTVGHKTYKGECPDELAPASIKALIDDLSKRNAKSEKAFAELNPVEKKEDKSKKKKKKDDAPGFDVDDKPT